MRDQHKGGAEVAGELQHEFKQAVSTGAALVYTQPAFFSSSTSMRLNDSTYASGSMPAGP